MPPFIISLLFIFLMILSFKDFKEGMIPDYCVGAVAGLGLFQFWTHHLSSALILGVLSYGLYKLYPLLKGKKGLGLGDVKLMAASGLWMPLFKIPFFLLISGVGGVVIFFIWQGLKKGPKFPLGPALALALGICIVEDQGFIKGENNMTMTFSGPTLAPASGGKPESLVVLIHGYGADGDDLLSLGSMWSSLLPNTLFVAPHGPMVCEMNPSGNQWFGLGDWDPGRILNEVQDLTPSFNKYLDDLLKTYELPSEKLALVGFSQGAMLALHVGLRRPQCAGVVAYSGAFLENSKEVLIGRPPVLLVHGTEDEVIPDSSSQMAEASLKVLGVPVTLSLLPGLGHGIDPRALGMGGAFLNEHLNKNAQSDL